MPFCVDCDETFKRPADKNYLIRCFDCYIKWKTYCDDYDPSGPSVQTVYVDKYGVLDHKKRLIQLCHPDKHGESTTANEITQWLNSLPRTK